MCSVSINRGDEPNAEGSVVVRILWRVCGQTAFDAQAEKYQVRLVISTKACFISRRARECTLFDSIQLDVFLL